MPLRPQPQQCSYNPSKFPITVREREREGDDGDEEYELYRFIQSNKKKILYEIWKQLNIIIIFKNKDTNCINFFNPTTNKIIRNLKTTQCHCYFSIYSIQQQIILLEIWKQLKCHCYFYE